MRFEPIRSSAERPPYTDVLGAYVSYEEADLDALRHLAEFLRKRFQITDEDLANDRKARKVLKQYPLFQIFDERVSLRKVIKDLYFLEEFPAIIVWIGFRFEHDRATFRAYNKELQMTKSEELAAAREVYRIVEQEYFPPKERMN